MKLSLSFVFECLGVSLSPFLAAMSSSRRDVVTQFVRLFVFSCVPFFLLVSSESVMQLECHIMSPRKFKGCMKIQVCFKEVSRMFQGSFKGV